MKEKKLTLNATNQNTTHKQALYERSHLKKSKDVQYLQINKISFQQNFKILMGHFKEDHHQQQ